MDDLIAEREKEESKAKPYALKNAPYTTTTTSTTTTLPPLNHSGGGGLMHMDTVILIASCAFMIVVGLILRKLFLYFTKVRKSREKYQVSE